MDKFKVGDIVVSKKNADQYEIVATPSISLMKHGTGIWSTAYIYFSRKSGRYFAKSADDAERTLEISYEPRKESDESSRN